MSLPEALRVYKSRVRLRRYRCLGWVSKQVACRLSRIELPLPGDGKRRAQVRWLHSLQWHPVGSVRSVCTVAT